ncbi:MAG: IS630 transposase-related protein [Moraxella sp.]|nr:IS630 transposase-related protein [Moraxella sp.]
MQQPKAYVEQRPDAYLYEIAQQFDCSIAAVFSTLKKMGITLEKKTTTYKEQDSVKVQVYLNQLKDLANHHRIY